ncbi:hypothetical protein KXE51_003548 [Salmonella enterica]|nr:hypothetical protein [Salmonella enterica]
MRKNIAIAIVGLALSALVFNANAALYLKSSGDQWSAAMADLQNGYNEGVSSNKFNRFTRCWASALAWITPPRKTS